MENFKVKTRDVIIYTIVIIIILVSYYINRGTDDTLPSVIVNYAPGSIALFLGLSWKKLSTKMRALYLTFSVIVLVYMVLHYLAGFQNYNWGN